MAFPIAMIPYTNMAPFRALGPPDGCRFVPLVPRLSVEALREKKVFAAAVPIGGLFALKGVVESLGDFGIAAKERSMSVLLFSKKKISDFTPMDRIHLTGESESSIRLLYLLLGYEYGFENVPVFSRSPSKDDVGNLIIGDRALTRLIRCRITDDESLSACSTWQITDLATRWYDVHRLPFVFARWVVRKDAPDGLKVSLAHWLDKFKDQESELVRMATPETAKTLGVTQAVVKEYFNVIRRSLTREDQLGERKFIEEFERHFKGELF